MNALESVFRALYCKGDGSIPTHVPAAVCMHTSTLSAWTLLLSTLTTSVLHQFLNKYVFQFSHSSCIVLKDENKVMKLAVGSEKILIFGQCGPEKLIWPGH